MMQDIIGRMSQGILTLIEHAGYEGIFLLSLFESAGILIPSEIVLPFSGFLVSQDVFSFWVVTWVATAGNVIGSLILYGIGIMGGRPILERYGKFVLIPRQKLELGDQWFSRYGVKVIFWGRLLPVVRTFISLPAGIARLSLRKFIVFTTVGALPWNFALTYLGLWAGDRWMIYESYIRKFNYIFLAVLVVVLMVYLIVRKHRKSI